MRDTPIFKSAGQQLVEANEGRPIGDLLTELYVEQGRSQVEIAERFGVHRLTVARWLRDYGIGPRYIGRRRAA